MKSTKRTHKYSGKFVAQLKATLGAAQATRDEALKEAGDAKERIVSLREELRHVQQREHGTREVADNAIAALTSAAAAIGFGKAHEARRTLLAVERDASRQLDAIWPSSHDQAQTMAAQEPGR